MSKTHRQFKRIVIFFLILLIQLTALPLSVLADNISDVSIDVQIHDDGSATVTEIWQLNITNPDSTEWYLDRYNLDNMEIKSLAVTELMSDGSERAFESLSSWNTSLSREEKAYKCGILPAKGGYELCWGFGENGQHTYRVTYTITNLFKSYPNGDIMTYRFIGSIAGAKQVNFHLRADSFAFEYPQTRIWVFGYEAETAFINNGIEIIGNGKFSRNDYAAVMLAFEPGLLNPSDTRSGDIDYIIERNLEGSDWENDSIDKNKSSLDKLKEMAPFLFPLLLSPFNLVFWLILILLWFRSRRRKKNSRETKTNYAQTSVEYCRDLPYHGSLSAAYRGLIFSNVKIEKTAIIGCFFLKWVQNGQIDIIQDSTGIVRKKEEHALKLHPLRPDMPLIEQELYKMVLEAAGRDQILQSKEMEKWAKKKYQSISSWLNRYRNKGMEDLFAMRAYQEVTVEKFFGLVKTKQNKKTPYGEELLLKAQGFARYLQDFTLLDEREVPEVKLWDDYLIFAQLFGMAEQFSKLYPRRLDTPADYSGSYDYDRDHWNRDYQNLAVTTAVTMSLHRSMAKGYRIAENRNSSSSSGSGSSGGGGSSSSGGGGSYSSGSGGSSSR